MPDQSSFKSNEMIVWIKQHADLASFTLRIFFDIARRKELSDDQDCLTRIGQKEFGYAEIAHACHGLSRFLRSSNEAHLDEFTTAVLKDTQVWLRDVQLSGE